MEILSSFIPMDRRHALARGATLPDRMSGAVLCVDISGFTALTEALVRNFGPQRGAEELTAILNRVYERLTSEVDRYGGSVITFSGDAFTCWFDDPTYRNDFAARAPLHPPALLRAATCATELQQRVAQFEQISLPDGSAVELAVKIALASGSARRFLVGDPQFHRIEVIAGATLDRLATIEHLARPGEIILSPETAHALWPFARTTTRPLPSGDSTHVALLDALYEPVAPHPWPQIDYILAPDVARPWLLPAVYEHLQQGDGTFLTELRLAVPLFLHFSGIDYDDDAAGERLDIYLRWVQQVLAHYGGTLIQTTMGDKGNYLYAAFGVPRAYPDAAMRAVEAALELRKPPPALRYISETQIGITSGQVRAGTYGGTTRAYGALGDVVNLAARLMEAAVPGQVLLSDSVSAAVRERYTLTPLPPISVKGKAEPVAVAALVGAQSERTIWSSTTRQLSPLVGREPVLALMDAFIQQALLGHKQVVGITAEAGVGKSRLVAEVVRRAREANMVVYGGEAQSYGTNSAYLAWQTIWHAFFEIDPEMALVETEEKLQKAIHAIDPTLVPLLPVLGSVLNLALPDNDLTRSLEPQRRKELLERLLLTCLHGRARQQPIVLVIEDMHWLDPLSADLLAALNADHEPAPVLFLLAYRPFELPGSLHSVHSQLNEIRLDELSQAEAHQLITFKLRKLFGSEEIVPSTLVERITALAGGNAFYIEELLHYVKDHYTTLHDRAALDHLSLPESLSSLILSRIDQLTTEQRRVLKVASIIGRIFSISWLWGVYPNLGSREQVGDNLDVLARLDLTPLEQGEPDWRYLFRHILTQEVTYDSMTFALREELHEQLASWIESWTQPDPPLDLLAFHYGRSANHAKQRDYFRRAGDAAAARFANETAIRYYQQLVDLLEDEEEEKGEVLLALGNVLKHTGAWSDAASRYHQALECAQRFQQPRLQAQAWVALGSLEWSRSMLAQAQDSLERARAIFTDIGAINGLVGTLNEIGALHRVRGDDKQARAVLEESMRYARQSNDAHGLARALHILGNIASIAGDYHAAREHFSESLSIRRQLGDLFGIAGSLNNLGMTYFDLQDYVTAQMLVDEGEAIFRQVGVRREVATSLWAQGRLALVREEAPVAWRFFAVCLQDFHELGAQWESVHALAGIANANALYHCEPARLEWAMRLAAAALRLLASTESSMLARDRAMLDRTLERTREALGQQAADAAWRAGHAMDWPTVMKYALRVPEDDEPLQERTAGQ